jgi:hypothetical protein
LAQLPVQRLASLLRDEGDVASALPLRVILSFRHGPSGLSMSIGSLNVVCLAVQARSFFDGLFFATRRKCLTATHARHGRRLGQKTRPFVYTYVLVATRFLQTQFVIRRAGIRHCRVRTRRLHQSSVYRKIARRDLMNNGEARRNRARISEARCNGQNCFITLPSGHHHAGEGNAKDRSAACDPLTPEQWDQLSDELTPLLG